MRFPVLTIFSVLLSRGVCDDQQASLRGKGRSLGGGCCSLNFQKCDGSFCGSTQSACENCDQQPVTWLSNGERDDCLAKWADCSNDPDGCCAPGACVPTTAEHSQCQYEAPSESPSVAPSEYPTPEPTDSKNGCCSLDFKNCDGTWCGSTRSECESCDQNVDVTWLPNGKRTWCKRKWDDCTHSPNSCCSPAKCVRVTNQYSQCQPE